MKTDLKSRFSAYIRRLLLVAPNITIDELSEVIETDSEFKRFKVTEATVAAGWRQLKKRWGISGPSDVPHYHGELNVSSMIRLYLNKYGMDKTEAGSRTFFEEDGITFRTNAFAIVKSTFAKKSKSRKIDVPAAALFVS